MLNEWVNRSADITAVSSQPASAASELKMKAEFMSRLISLNAPVPLGLGHNYEKWLPVDAATAAAPLTAAAPTATATTAAGSGGGATGGSGSGSGSGGGITATAITTEKLKGLTHGVWSDSGP